MRNASAAAAGGSGEFPRGTGGSEPQTWSPPCAGWHQSAVWCAARVRSAARFDTRLLETLQGSGQAPCEPKTVITLSLTRVRGSVTSILPIPD